jgi:hypothetical protein
LTEIIPEHDATSLGKEIFEIMQLAYKKNSALLVEKGCRPLNTSDNSFIFFSLYF